MYVLFSFSLDELKKLFLKNCDKISIFYILLFYILYWWNEIFTTI